MVHWYRHDIPSWRGGTASLTHEQYRLYHVICEQIYLEEGPIKVHERTLAGQANMSTRLLRSTLAKLVDSGKLQVVFEGKIDNFRTRTELEQVANTRRTYREIGAKGGRTSAERRRKVNEINGHGQAPLKNVSSGYVAEKRREDKSREEKKEKDIDSWPSDFREQFWRAYPKKVSKETGIKALERVHKGGRVLWPDLLAAVMRYAAAVSDTDPQFTKMPTTWLNGGCWDDDPAALQRTNPNGHAPRLGSKEHQREETANAYRQLCEFAQSGSDDRARGSRASDEDARLLPFPKRP